MFRPHSKNDIRSNNITTSLFLPSFQCSVSVEGEESERFSGMKKKQLRISTCVHTTNGLMDARQYDRATGHKTNGDFYYSVDLSKDVKYKAEAAV